MQMYSPPRYLHRLSQTVISATSGYSNISGPKFHHLNNRTNLPLGM